MQALYAFLSEELGVAAALQPWLALGVMLAGATAIVLFASLYSGVFIFLERRIAGRMMSRIGPNRVGPHGLLQFVADALKLLVKEDLIPKSADRPLFIIAPYLMAVGGAAYLVAKAIKGAKVLGFADLGMEAIYEFEVQDMPVTVAVDSEGQSVHETGPAEWRMKIGKIPVRKT